MMAANEHEIRDLIFKLNKNYFVKDEEKLRFILSDISPPNSNEGILDIFAKLIDKEDITVNKLDLLYELLNLLDQRDLRKILPTQSPCSPKAINLISPYKQMLVDVGNKLEDDDCHRLASVYHSEGFNKPWKLFMHLEKRSFLKNERPDLNVFMKSLEEVGCNNAASLVKTFLKGHVGYSPIIDHAAKTLSDRYCRFCNVMQSLPWDTSKGIRKLKDIFINLNIIFEKENYGAEFPFPEFHKMFDPAESVGDNQYRILIRGIAGTGKTTILQRLSLDWGESLQKKLNGQPEESDNILDFIKDFKLLFLLEIRKINLNQSLFSAVHSQLLHGFSKKDMKAVEAFVKNEPSKVVFMLDGYDELIKENVNDDRCQSKLFDILRCNDLPSCHVVVTTRPHRVKDFKRIHRFYKHFELKGFTRENVKQYVDRYFSNCPESGDKLMKYIRDLNFVEGIAEIPIMTAIMCYLWEFENYKSSVLPRTPSKLYSQLFQFLEKKYEERDQMRIKKPRNNLNLQKVKSKIGEIGLCSLETNGDLIFRKHKLDKLQQKAIEDACVIGIMHSLNGDKERSDNPFEPTEEVQFFHKSAQEKCAAIYLASLLEKKKSSTKFMNHLTKVSSVRNALDMHLMLKFTCAESNEAAKLVLERLGNIYNQYPQETWEGFNKGDLPIEEIKEMQQFLELCIGCNFEADKEGILFEQMTTFFPEGRIRFTGISNYTAMSLAFFLKYTNSINHIELLRLGVDDNTQVRALMDKIPSSRHFYTKSMTDISPENEEFANTFKAKIPKGSFLSQIPVKQMYGIYPLYKTLKEWQAEEIHLGIVFDGMNANMKSLTISGIQIKGTDFDSFVNLLHRVKTLESLCLNSNNFGPGDLEIFSKCIGGMTKLKILTLSGNNVSDGFVSVLDHLKARRLLEIEEIWVEKCNLSSKTLCATIDAFDNTPNLRVLDIRLNEITNDVFKALAPKMGKLPQLENLNMTSNNVDSNGYEPFFEEIKQMNKMKRLHLADSTFSGTLLYHIATVIPELPNLEYLHVSGKNVKEIKEIPNQIFRHFIDNLPKLKALKELNLVIIKLRKEDFQDLITVCKDLQKITDVRISFDLVPNGIDKNDLPKFIKLC
ncbi:NLR family CARD domain-containing protein 4-like [Anneissia japonica]|uniref:NLR family CARD domain-containing protein 4-like n=1 Tax=Anneissia japonica TaxID=1529436 RepID=UPI00142577B1|nr:NLR family CARD domain-containing protein 4-like [Anneissia japonica]